MMNQLCLADTFSEFNRFNIFKQVQGSEIDQLIWNRQKDLKGIKGAIDALNSPQLKTGFYYLNKQKEHYRTTAFLSFEEAKSALDADYWARAIALTDIQEYMPADKRMEWNECVSNWETPEFSQEAVYSTLIDLLNNRAKYLAERVDTVFNKLSGAHITNSPMGFGQKMIFAGVTDKFGDTVSSKVEYLHDLRFVIAKFMDRRLDPHTSTGKIVASCRKNPGNWYAIDGGAFEIKLFKSGTAHIKVHSDIAWRLNEILAELYPMAIPSEFRNKPERKIKTFNFAQRLISGRAIGTLAEMEATRIWDRTGYEPRCTGSKENCVSFRYQPSDKEELNELEEVLFAAGGVKTSYNEYQFDYDFLAARHEILCFGAIPCHKSHQYYPTPESLAEPLVEWCDIEEGDICLEPEAGTGGIAKFMPKDATCVEVSKLHCTVLEAMGHNVICADFIDWSARTKNRYDAICMNPPFSEGRAEQHLQAAAELLTSTGRLTAILPASMKNRPEMKGFDYEWSDPIENAFEGTGVTVIMLKLTRTA